MVKRLFFGKAADLFGVISTQSKAMLDLTVKTHLVRKPLFGQNLLAQMPLLGREDVVFLSCSHGEGSLETLQLSFLYKRWMGDESHFDIWRMSNDILAVCQLSGDHLTGVPHEGSTSSTNLSAEAISSGSNGRGTFHLFQIFDCRLDDGIDSIAGMRVVARGSSLKPRKEVEIVRTIESQGISIEDVNDQSCVAVTGVLVGNQLAILPDTDDIGEKKKGDIVVSSGSMSRC